MEKQIAAHSGSPERFPSPRDPAQHQPRLIDRPGSRLPSPTDDPRPRSPSVIDSPCPRSRTPMEYESTPFRPPLPRTPPPPSRSSVTPMSPPPRHLSRHGGKRPELHAPTEMSRDTSPLTDFGDTGHYEGAVEQPPQPKPVSVKTKSKATTSAAHQAPGKKAKKSRK